MDHSYAMKSILCSGKLVHLLYSNVIASCTDFDWQIPHTLEVAYESLVIVGHIYICVKGADWKLNAL